MADLSKDLVAALNSEAAKASFCDLIRLVLREELAAVIPAHNQLVDADEAAVILGMSKAGVYAAAARGTLPVTRVGRRLRFSRAELLTLGKERAQEGAAR